MNATHKAPQVAPASTTGGAPQTSVPTQTTPPQPAIDPFFTPIANTKPYFKAAFQGFAGSGKTYTAARIALGIHKRIGSTKPIVIFDTEKASKFLVPLFNEHGIQAIVRESRTFADLTVTMQKMREGVSDILLIDSLSHIWEEFLKAYQEKTRRSSLQFQDWGIIKPTWKSQFSDPFVRDQYHAIFTGRAGYEYSNEMNEDTHKREIYKSGVKMKVEGETAYEPDFLVYMERFENILDDKKEVYRQATVLKDRSTILDGKTFKDPSYNDFAPAIDALLENAVAPDAFQDPEGETALLFKTEEQKADFRRDRDRWVEELEGLLIRIAPASTGKDKQLKLDLLDEAYGTTSMTAIGQMKISEIRDGYRAIGHKAVDMGIAEIIMHEGRERLVRKEAEKAPAKEKKAPAKKKAEPAPEDPTA